LVRSGFVIYSAGTTHLLYFNVINNFKNVRSRSNVRTLKMSVDTLKGGSSVSTFILNVRTLKINRGHPEPAGIKHVYQWAEFAIHMEI
jgi:hypothetical protein